MTTFYVDDTAKLKNTVIDRLKGTMILIVEDAIDEAYDLGYADGTRAAEPKDDGR